MSIRSGDRARANKQANKRRFRRQEIKLLKRLLTPAKVGDSETPAAALMEHKAAEAI